MIRQFFHTVGDRLSGYIIDLLKPREDVLHPFAEQWAVSRTRTMMIIGLALTALAAAVLGFYLVVLPPWMRLYLVAPLGFMVLLTIWVLPDYDDPPTNLMQKALVGFIVAASIWPVYLAISIPGLPWISMRRLFLGPMVLALAVSMSISHSFRTRLKTYLMGCPPIAKMMLAFVIIQTLSLTLSPNHTEAVKNYINLQTTWTCVFLVSVYMYQDITKFDKVVRLLLFGAALIGTIAFFEYREQRVLWVGYVPFFLQVDSDLLESLTNSNFRNGLFRVKSVFTTPLAYAEFMALVSVICMHYAMRSRSIIGKIGFGALDFAILYTTSLSQARLGNLGWIVAHAAFFLLWSIRRWKANRASLIGPALSIAYPVMVIALFIAISSISFLSNRVFGSAAQQGSNQARIDQFNAAVPKMAMSPIFGYGPGQGGAVLNFRIGSFLTIDSHYLSIALDYGIVGFFLFFGMFSFGMSECLRMLLYEEGDDSDRCILILSMLTAFLLTRSVLSQEDNVWMAFMLLGAIVAMIRRVKAART